VAGLLSREDVQYLVTVSCAEGTPVRGAAELIHVRTLQYEGLWIEALRVAGQDAESERAALALFGAAIEEVKRREELDLVGLLASPGDRTLYAAAVSEGMKPIESYKSFIYEY
jgi:hypothetical protein